MGVETKKAENTSREFNLEIWKLTLIGHSKKLWDRLSFDPQ